MRITSFPILFILFILPKEFFSTEIGQDQNDEQMGELGPRPVRLEFQRKNASLFAFELTK